MKSKVIISDYQERLKRQREQADQIGPVLRRPKRGKRRRRKG